MHIFAHERSLEGAVESQHVLFTGFTGLVGDVLFDGVTIGKFHGLQFFCGSRESSDSCICDATGQGFEVRGGGHEVGLATEADEDGLAAVYTAEHSTLGGLVFTALGEGGFTFLAQDFHSTLELTGSLFEGLFAVHHASAGHVAEFLDIC